MIWLGSTRKKTVNYKLERNAVQSTQILPGTQRPGEALSGCRACPKPGLLPVRMASALGKHGALLVGAAFLRRRKGEKGVKSLEDLVLRFIWGTAASVHPPVPEGHEPPSSPPAWEVAGPGVAFKIILSFHGGPVKCNAFYILHQVEFNPLQVIHFGELLFATSVIQLLGSSLNYSFL